MTVGEIIQRVQSAYSKGVQSKDSRLTSRHIYSAAITARSTLIRQQIDKEHTVSDWAYQYIPCVELIPAPKHECPCVPANNCTILRSKHKLPKPVQASTRSLIKSVTNLDGDISFGKTRFEDVKSLDGHKYTSKIPRYYIKNGYLYIVGMMLLKAVPVAGLFEDVIEVYNYPTPCTDCPECQCKDIMELDFPIDGNLVEPLIQKAQQELVVIMKQVQSDETANASDDAQTRGSMIHQG